MCINDLNGIVHPPSAGPTAIFTAPNGWTNFAAHSIIDSGEVAGYGFNGVFFQGFVYTTASGIAAIPLPLGATTLSFVEPIISINNHGTVMGSSDAGAWTWSSSQGTVLLNSQVPAGWNISQVSGINDNGVILAYASFNSGLVQQVELIPSPLSDTPAPSTLLLLLIGLTGCTLWSARRACRV